jgi:hypothetical protein
MSTALKIRAVTAFLIFGYSFAFVQTHFEINGHRENTIEISSRSTFLIGQ